MLVNYFIAQTYPDKLIENSSISAENIAINWQKQWLNILQVDTGNNIYGALTRLGIFLAVGTLMIFMVQWLRDILENDYSRPISSLLTPFVIVLLLANTGNGTTLSHLSIGTNSFLNSINQQVVQVTNQNQVYQQAIHLSVAEDILGSLLRPCQSLSGEIQRQCLIQAKSEIDRLWQIYRYQYGNQPWINHLENQTSNLIINRDIVSELEFNNLLTSSPEMMIKKLLISCQFAFQNLIEAAMLLTAILGPVALGASLLPVFGKPIFAWITGFFALAIAKISFNIITLTTATVIMETSKVNDSVSLDLTWFLICVGILAPVLSLIIAGLGGIATFNAISNSSAWIQQRI